MKIENRGGARPGTGPKKVSKVYSEKVKRSWLSAAKKLAKEHGETVEYAALKLIWDEKVQGSVKASVLKAYNEALIIRESESKTEVTKQNGPAVYLPEKKADPAKMVVVGGSSVK